MVICFHLRNSLLFIQLSSYTGAFQALSFNNLFYISYLPVKPSFWLLLRHVFCLCTFSHDVPSASMPFLTLYSVCQNLAIVMPLFRSLFWSTQRNLSLPWTPLGLSLSLMEFIFHFILKSLSPLLQKNFLEWSILNMKLCFNTSYNFYLIKRKQYKRRVSNEDFPRYYFFNLFILLKVM